MSLSFLTLAKNMFDKNSLLITPNVYFFARTKHIFVLLALEKVQSKRLGL